MHGTVRTKAPVSHFEDYAARYTELVKNHDWSTVAELADELHDCWKSGRQVFLTGNGGSAGNAVHLANDLLYAWSKKVGRGIRVHALPATPAVMTCLANDEGYDEVFSAQLAVHAQPGDVLVVFSGSGNSKNILRALETAKEIGMRSYAVVGFDGGKALSMCDVPIHFKTDDMQIAEDAQLMLGHMIVQYLFSRRDGAES